MAENDHWKLLQGILSSFYYPPSSSCHHSSSFGWPPPSPSGDDVIYEQPPIRKHHYLQLAQMVRFDLSKQYILIIVTEECLSGIHRWSFLSSARRWSLKLNTLNWISPISPERIIEFRFQEALGLCNTSPWCCNSALSGCYDQMILFRKNPNSQMYLSKLTNIYFS